MTKTIKISGFILAILFLSSFAHAGHKDSSTGRHIVTSGPDITLQDLGGNISLSLDGIPNRYTKGSSFTIKPVNSISSPFSNVVFSTGTLLRSGFRSASLVIFYNSDQLEAPNEPDFSGTTPSALLSNKSLKGTTHAPYFVLGLTKENTSSKSKKIRVISLADPILTKQYGNPVISGQSVVDPDYKPISKIISSPSLGGLAFYKDVPVDIPSEYARDACFSNFIIGPKSIGGKTHQQTVRGLEQKKETVKSLGYDRCVIYEIIINDFIQEFVGNEIEIRDSFNFGELDFEVLNDATGDIKLAHYMQITDYPETLKSNTIDNIDELQNVTEFKEYSIKSNVALFTQPREIPRAPSVVSQPEPVVETVEEPETEPETPQPAPVVIPKPVVVQPQPVATSQFSSIYDRPAYSVGERGEHVKQLQVFLNTNGFIVSATGFGSKGNETTYFGPATAAAVSKFQASVGLSQVGIVGPGTQKAIKDKVGSPVVDRAARIAELKLLIQELLKKVAELRAQQQ